MKKTTLIISILFSLSGTAQLSTSGGIKKSTIGKISVLGDMVAELSFTVDKNNDTIFLLSYKDQGYEILTQYNVVAFRNTNDAINNLYSLLTSFIKDEGKHSDGYYESAMLGDNRLSIKSRKYMGKVTITIFTDEGYFYLSEKGVKKLFDK